MSTPRPDNYNATLLREFPIKSLVIGYQGFAVAGILLNLLILGISFRKGYITGNFRDFIVNLAIVDLIVSVANFFYSFLFLDLFYSGIFCAFGGFFWMYGPVGAIFALIPVSINRYIVICRENSAHIFTKRFNVILCLIFDIMPALIILPFGTVFGRFGRKPGRKGVLCLSYREAEHMARVQYYVVYAGFSLLSPIIAVGVVVCLNMRIYIKIRNHQTTVQASMAVQKRLRETAQVARATLIQAIAPAVMQISLTILITMVFTRLHTYLNVADAPLYGMIVLTANPMIDALVTLHVVRPYHRGARRAYRKLRGLASTAQLAAGTVTRRNAGTTPASRRLEMIGQEGKRQRRANAVAPQMEMWATPQPQRGALLGVREDQASASTSKM